MSESDDKPFSVSDRRHFTPEGRPREEESEAEKKPGVEREPAAPQGEEPLPGERPRRPAGPVDFSAFLLSLGAQAGLLLSGGGEPAPSREEAAAALDGARQIIDILEMLRDKTEGRRTDEETRVLESLLFQLRMLYVEKSRGPRP